MTNDQFAKLTQQISRLDDKLSSRMDRFDRQSLNLYKYAEDRFADVYVEIQNVRYDVQRVYTLIDASLKQQEIDQHERLAMGSQLDRHDRWIEKAAEQIRLKYDPSISA